MRRTGLVEGTEAERDPDQVRLAIEAVRAVLPLLEPVAPSQVGSIRDALSQLQLAYVRIGGTAAETAQAGPHAPPPSGAQAPPTPREPPPAAGESQQPDDPSTPGDPGPAQRSGRLWVPGQ